MRDDPYISSPRPLWKDEDQETRTKRIITLGSTTGGIVVKITKKGVEFNGYYAGLQEPKKYANVRDFVFVSWKDFDKLREEVHRRKKPKKKVKARKPDTIDKKLDQEYLDGLPQVTLNGKKYYIDVDRQERRPVENPEQVFNFETQAAKEPS